VLTDRVIADGSLRREPAGFSFDLRIPWYRSLPLSCVEGLEVSVDGERIAEEDLRITFDGRAYELADLPPLFDEWWYVTDPARVEISRPLEPGQHELDVTLSLRIPYIVEAGRRLVMRERCVKTELVR
jgi:hypothetical protein